MIYDGPDIEKIRINNWVKIPVASNTNISLQFVMRRIKPLRKLERRPDFLHDKCTECLKCVKICPVNAIKPHQVKKNWIVLTDSKCIRCYCCAEVCMDKAVRVRRKVFGA
jgi:ferredoxin